MTRRDGPLQRVLMIMAEPDARAVLERELRAACGPLCEVTLHDMTGTFAAMPDIGFNPLTGGARMLNTATAVIDLRLDEPALLAAMNGNTRRKLRQAEEVGVTWQGDAQRNPDVVARFLAAYNAMAGERSLAGFGASQAGAVFAKGDGRLAAAFSADGGSACFVMTYEAGDSAIFLHGASDGPPDPLLGATVHWRLVGALKAANRVWYDLGGLPPPGSADGITRFKLALGAQTIDLGAEYRRTGAGFAAARRVLRLVGR